MATGLGVLLATPGLAAERSLEDAVYTRDQARAGKKLYSEHCIACHERGYFRQVLRTRGGETLRPIFDLMVTEMPQNAPGSLSDDEYLDVLSYMLSDARYAAGDRALGLADLRGIVIPASD